MSDAISTAAAIDRDHLREMTMGDDVLARDVLALFDRQAAIMMRRLPQANAAEKGEMAHALKGSARGIGAWKVADAAALVEIAGDPVALKELNEALADAQADIARMLRQNVPVLA
jgi:hypothetical protein